jgi:pSer/pThr/pTyr-binding forkhead associated (FHA) protein
MKLKLTPISHQALGELPIPHPLFSVGCDDAPFNSLPEEDRQKLSRRHAKIFTEGGSVYIVDFGSATGTRVNGVRVGKAPQQIKDGDQIAFADVISFRLSIQGSTDVDVTQSIAVTTTLVLSPSETDTSLETIVVSHFPFLISRTDDLFDRHKQRYPDDVPQISRRHALFSLQGDDVYLEDLESVNGTFVSGERLDEHARRLNEGDLITFGSDRFSYRVHIELPHRPSDADESHVSAPTQSDLIEPDARTTFINSSTSFLEIFCESSANQINKAESGEDVETSGTSGRSQSRGLAVSVLGGLFNGDGTSRKWWKWSFVIIVAVSLMGIGVFWYGTERREIKSLLDAKQYSASTIAAARYLSTKSDEEVGDWGREALIKWIVPIWMEHIENNDFEQALRILNNAQRQSQFIPDAMELLNTLMWANAVASHMAERGGQHAPLVLFRHEDEIERIVTEWRTHDERYQRTLTQVAAVEPGFSSLRAQLLSDLRQLRNDHSLSGKAITQLKSAISSALSMRQSAELRSTIEQFRTKYPRVTGTQHLLTDVTHYEELLSSIEEGDLDEIARLGQESEFRTPVFKEWMRIHLGPTLPSSELIAQYKEAENAWRAGAHTQSKEILARLVTLPWGGVAKDRIARQEAIHTEYKALLERQQDSDFDEQLLAFWITLKKPDDEFFLEQFRDDVAKKQSRAQSQLEKVLQDTQLIWKAYKDDGGIPAVIRVEAKISKRFRKQAERLLSAYSGITRAVAIFDLLGQTLPDRWSTLQTRIHNEAQRQRRSLEDLHLVMAPDLLQAKLELLPQVQERNL